MSGEENKIVNPKTDSELFLNNADQCDWKNDSCAGANAASRADMTLATTDPLSELVWSSDKGLSLKCADSSFADKNSSLFRDVGPSCYNQYQVDQRPTDDLLLQLDEPKPIMEQNSPSRRPPNEGINYDTGNAVEPVTEYKGSGAAGTNLTSSSRNPIEKLESSAENDLRNVDAENKYEGNETTLPCVKVLPVLHSPCNSKIRMAKNKGKEKSLSDGDANVRLSMDNDSNSSVESCNSARFFSTGKKRHNSQQQLMIGSKRVKIDNEETSGSKSYIKQESSFRNWISSMVKGLSQSTQDDSNTLAVSLANPNLHNAWFDEKLITCKTNQNPEPKNTGFKSIFQSMYYPSLKNIGTRMFHQEGEGDEDLEPSNNTVHGINATPITCFPEINCLNKRHFQSNKFEAASERYDAGPSQPNIEPLNFYNSQEISKINPAENENCSNLCLSKDKEEMVSNSSSIRENTNNTDNVDSNAPSERKKAENISHRKDNPGSLWITRFAPKSSGFEEDERNNSQKLKYMFNDLSSSSRGFTNSEQMASTFARRFVGLKHIMPTDKPECTSQVNMFCLFCGKRGHQLSDCSAVAESELEDLQENVNSYEGPENFPFMCIKCFQLNHWAVSCSSSISKRKSESEVKTFVHEGTARPVQIDKADRILSGGTIHDGIHHKTDQNINLKRKSNDVINAKIECNASCKKYCGSSSKENKYKEKPSITSPSRLAEKKISHVPEGIFDAVKKLQLSRTDILKWVTAHGSFSQLEGFFLRLRLGKWEEGLGGTGYHVACITISESEKHSLEKHTRKSLSVKVGGIKCMVESHYISNQDFLEEEIMEWWSANSEAGVEIPSEEDLISKFKKKQMLGL